MFAIPRFLPLCTSPPAPAPAPARVLHSHLVQHVLYPPMLPFAIVRVRDGARPRRARCAPRLLVVFRTNSRRVLTALRPGTPLSSHSSVPSSRFSSTSSCPTTPSSDVDAETLFAQLRLSDGPSYVPLHPLHLTRSCTHALRTQALPDPAVHARRRLAGRPRAPRAHAPPLVPAAARRVRVRARLRARRRVQAPCAEPPSRPYLSARAEGLKVVLVGPSSMCACAPVSRRRMSGFLVATGTVATRVPPSVSATRTSV